MDVIAEALEREPDAVALDDGARRWSYRELSDDTRRIARGLRRRGVEPGALVGTVLPPTSEAVLAIHGVLAAGAGVAPLHPRLTEAEMAAALAGIDAGVVLTGPAGRFPRPAGGRGPGETRGEGGRSEGPLMLRVDELLEEGGGRNGAKATEAGPAAAGQERVAVLWTSGTAGRPRGVLLTGAAFRANAGASRERLGLGPGDRWFLSLSPAHVGGLALILRAALLGATVVTREGFDAATLDGLIDEGEVTHVSLVPTMLRWLLETRAGRPAPSGVECVLVGGARAPRALVEEAVSSGWPVALTYGMTEATSQVATAPPGLVRRKPDSVGPPLRCSEVRIDGSGEILVRGETLARGYLESGGSSAERTLTDEDGWFHTGDIGELDGDGHLRIVGRRSERIVTGGANVDPVEVEEVLRLHEEVDDVAVAGVPDPEWGELVAAFVVPAPGSYPSSSDLQRLARSRLTTSKIPRRVRFGEALPRTSTGKVDRREVRRLLEEDGS